jgi:hypothetical protein
MQGRATPSTKTCRLGTPQIQRPGLKPSHLCGTHHRGIRSFAVVVDEVRCFPMSQKRDIHPIVAETDASRQ